MNDNLETKQLLVSKKEAARLLGVCVRTVEGFVSRKQLTARKIGRRVLIPFSAIEQFAKRDHATSEQSDGR